MSIKKWWFEALATLILVSAFCWRIYQVTEVPPAPYWEEVALGYDAYSLLKTGQDHHGNPWPIVAVESFGDWKPSLYFYSVMPFIQLFGLSVLAVRLPAVLSGVAIVGGVGALAYLVSSDLATHTRKKLALIAMAVTTISPWALLFSRAGWEVNLATALILWAVVAGLSSLVKVGRLRPALFLTAAVLLVLSMYTYHAARIVAPVLGIGLSLLSLVTERTPKLKPQLLQLTLAGLVSLVLLAPLIWSLGSPTTNQRFAETSIFSDLSIIEESNALKAAAGNSFQARIFYHRYLLFGREILSHYLSHFRLDFLFISGDVNPRHSVQYLGQLYHLEFFFLVLGSFYFFKRWHQGHALLLLWLVIGLVPASITQASPHALRLLPTLPIWMILISYGLQGSISELGPWLSSLIKVKQNKVVAGVVGLIVMVYLLEFAVFWRYYSRIYPVVQAHEWQFGYQELVKNIQGQVAHYDTIYITRQYGRPAMYYWFYTQTDPTQVQAADATALQDQGEFLQFDNLRFIRSVAEVDQTPALVASTETEYHQMKDHHLTRVIETILDPSGKVVWLVYEVE